MEQKNNFSLLSLLSMRPGALAGAAATIPMTAFLLATQRALPPDQQEALPPEGITEEMAKRANVDDQLNKPELLGASLTSHIGYGASMGLAYNTMAKKLPLPPIVKGSLFGLIVWAGSYVGWLPLGKFPQAATNQPPQRNLMMIGAHIIWGAATGVLTQWLEEIL